MEHFKDSLKDNEKKQKTGFIKKIKNMLIPSKGDKVNDVIFKIILDASIIVFIVSAILLFNHYYGNYKSKNLNNDLKNIYSNASVSSESQPESSSSQSEPKILQNFDELLKINSETVGWLEVPDSTISYPILQTKDNDFYLNHNFKKEKSDAGALFVDFRYPISSGTLPGNTIIYGHNMKSGDFFGNLHKYRNIDFMKTHSIIKFNTLYKEEKWKVVACFLTNVEPKHDNGVVFDYHNRINFSTEAAFKDFYDNVMKRSFYNTDVDVKYGDQFLTLSTCSYEFDNSRFVVVARKVRDGEDANINTDKIVKNPNIYMPIAWYEVTKQTPPKR